MLKILALSYSELLLIIVHYSWIAKKKKISPTPTSLFSFLSHFTLLSSLPMVVVRRWFDGLVMVRWFFFFLTNGPMVMVRFLGCGSRFLGCDFYFFYSCLWLQWIWLVAAMVDRKSVV